MVWDARRIVGIRSAVRLALVIAGLFLVRIGFPQERARLALPENPLAGAPIFIEKGCIKCHSILGFGESFGPDLTQVGQEMDFFQIAGALCGHSPKMIEVMEEKGIPRFLLTPDETEKLITFIYYLGFFEQMGDYVKGEEIFSRKGCAQCHSLGRNKPRSLDKYGQYASPAFIAAELWNHSSTISSSMSAKSFGPGEMSHLLAFIRGEAWNPEGVTLNIPPGNPRVGQHIYQEKRCSVCHGENGQGLMTNPLRKGLTEIVGMMWSHSSQMWSEMRQKGLNVPRFSAEEMSDLMTFIYFLQLYGGTGNIRSGEKIFAEKGCLSCHGPAEVNKKKGMDLKDVSIKSISELVSAMWNHVPEMEKAVSEFNMGWPRFGGNEMKDLISYIQSLK